MATTVLKRGTRIETLGTNLDGSEFRERAKIVRQAGLSARDKAARPDLAGFDYTNWYIIQYDAGGSMCCHQSRFVVTDNRGSASK